jgi:hypothetical protein
VPGGVGPDRPSHTNTQPKGFAMFTNNIQFLRQYADDRHEQLRRQAGATRLRREWRDRHRERRP